MSIDPDDGGLSEGWAGGREKSIRMQTEREQVGSRLQNTNSILHKSFNATFKKSDIK
jgi:hypothetical protein